MQKPTAPWIQNAQQQHCTPGHHFATAYGLFAMASTFLCWVTCSSSECTRSFHYIVPSSADILNTVQDDEYKHGLMIPLVLDAVQLTSYIKRHDQQTLTVVSNCLLPQALPSMRDGRYFLG